MAEWWEPQGFQAWFYGPYRDIVNRSIEVRRDGCDGDDRRKGLVILIPRTDRIRTTEIVILAAAVGIMGFALGIRFGARR